MRLSWVVPAVLLGIGGSLSSFAFVGCSSDSAAPAHDAGADDGNIPCTPFNAGPAGPEVGFFDTTPLDDGAIPEAPPPPDVGPRVLRAEVDDIFKNSCSFASGCHGSKPGQANLFIPPRSVSDWYPNLVNVTSTENPKMKLITKGDPQNSWVVHKMVGDLCAFKKDCKDTCGERMPQASTLPAVVAGDFSKIVEWIRQGAPEE
jgi:hypothetical protein